MIWEIVKKQGLTFIRNPQQLLLLIALPIILIVILSISLSGFINGDTIEIEAKVAMIEHTDEKKQIDKFLQEIEQSELHEADKIKLAEIAKQVQIIKILKENVFQEMEDMIQMDKFLIADKNEVLNNDEYAAVIEVSANFTYDSLRYLLLEEGGIGTITIYENEGKSIGATAVKSIVEGFQEQLAMSTFVGKHDIDTMVMKVNAQEQIGEITTVGQSKPISSKEYYTIAMAVMNVLYIATTIASFAFLEKQSQVFNRIILSNASRWSYFMGIFVSSVIFAFIQLLILFGFARIIFGVSWESPLFFVVTFTLSLAVGGLSVLLTAISYRANSEAVINFFSFIIVVFFALIGGSFFPISELSDIFGQLGDLTPNGAGMSAYLSLLRGNGLEEIAHHLIYLLIFTAGLLVISVLSFPKRGHVS